MTVYDAIMIGGGVMGCATAYHLLKNDPALKVAIIEKDPSYKHSSTVLSDGNHRIQFNVKENIQISQYGFEMLENFAELMAVGDKKPDIDFRKQGNLFLTDDAGVEFTKNGMTLQQSLGCEVEWLSPDAIAERFEFIDKTSISGGTYSPNDGTMDPQAVLLGYKDKAVDLGATYIVDEVIDVLVNGERVTGVKLSDGTVLNSQFLVNSSGAWGKKFAEQAGFHLPMKAIKRHVFHIETHITPPNTVPLTVFPSGLYLIHEGGNHFLCGKSLDVDPEGFDFTFNRQLFTDYFWEDLVNHMPAMEQLKVAGGWAGLYAVNTFDHNAILGEIPAMKGFLLANGFSGHGFQQCHAVGRYLAERILGIDVSLDLSIFSPERILNNTPVLENPHKIV